MTDKERTLIKWLVWEHLKGSMTSNAEDWYQPRVSVTKGGKGWRPARQAGGGVLRLLYWYQNIHKPGSKEWRPTIIIRAALAEAEKLKGGGE